MRTLVAEHSDCPVKKLNQVENSKPRRKLIDTCTHQLLRIIEDPWIQQAEKSLLADGRCARKKLLPTTTPVATERTEKMELFLLEEEDEEEDGKFWWHDGKTMGEWVEAARVSPFVHDLLKTEWTEAYHARATRMHS